LKPRNFNPVDTCYLPSGYEWRYQKLKVIIFVVFRPCMCTCLSVASST